MLDYDNIYFVLVRPAFLGNIGSSARVLKNFGFRNLRLVKAPKNYKDAEARKMAVGAFDVLKSAQCFDSFAAAQRDISISVGTTCGFNRSCQADFLDKVSNQIKALSTDPVAIFFGDEKDGLMREELARCHYTVSVPTVPGFPSLNVAQAVGMFCYELTRSSTIDLEPARNESMAVGAETDEYFENLSTLLAKIGMTKSFNRERVLTELRVILNRAQLSKRELQLLDAILRKTDQATELVRTKTK